MSEEKKPWELSDIVLFQNKNNYGYTGRLMIDLDLLKKMETTSEGNVVINITIKPSKKDVGPKYYGFAFPPKEQSKEQSKEQ